MDGKITSVDKAVSERMKQFMAHYGYTQVAIAEACNVDVSTLSRYMNNKKPWSSKMLQKIGSVFNVAFLWLRDGIGEMFAEEKAIGKAQFAAFSQMLNANASPVSQNVISGDNYQGTQTINATEGKITALEQKIDAQAELLSEKDRLIASQQAWLSDKDKLIARQEAEIAELRERLKQNWLVGLGRIKRGTLCGSSPTNRPTQRFKTPQTTTLRFGTTKKGGSKRTSLLY